MSHALCDDSASYDEHVLDRGTEEQMKRRYHEAIKTGAVDEGNAYIEDEESGDQIAWNPHTKAWDEL